MSCHILSPITTGHRCDWGLGCSWGSWLPCHVCAINPTLTQGYISQLCWSQSHIYHSPNLPYSKGIGLLLLMAFTPSLLRALAIWLRLLDFCYLTLMARICYMDSIGRSMARLLEVCGGMAAIFTVRHKSLGIHRSTGYSPLRILSFRPNAFLQVCWRKWE